MSEYKKTTKEDIYFPDYCLFFIKEIKESLDENGITNPGDELDLEIETVGYPYCYDAFKAVVRALRKKGYLMNVPGFKREKREGKEDMIVYKFVIRKMGVDDDLPF